MKTLFIILLLQSVVLLFARVGEIINNTVEQRLHALVFQRSANKDWRECALEARSTNCRLDVTVCWSLFLCK